MKGARENTLEELRSLIKLSGIPFDKDWEMVNQYWPEAYLEIRANSPWLLVRTPKGMIEIGYRKRVLSIDWKDTGIERIITEDDVTKTITDVHAWTLPKALEYLTEIGKLLK